MRSEWEYKGGEFGISEKEHPWKPAKIMGEGPCLGNCDNSQIVCCVVSSRKLAQG